MTPKQKVGKKTCSPYITTQSNYLYPVNALKNVFRGKMVSLTQGETVVKYLSQYTYRIAISNTRIIKVDEQFEYLFTFTGKIMPITTGTRS